jgi:hypothetical protein
VNFIGLFFNLAALSRILDQTADIELINCRVNKKAPLLLPVLTG